MKTQPRPCRSAITPLLLLLLLYVTSSSAAEYRALDPQLWPGADLDAAVSRLSRALQQETVSRAPAARDAAQANDADGASTTATLVDPSTMLRLHEHLRLSYPTVFASLGPRGRRGTASSLLSWLSSSSRAAEADASPQPAVTTERLGCGDLSLLITVRGSNPSLRPILLVSHLDVVPVSDLQAWTKPPFSGAVFEAHVWGRGAVDVKGPAVALLEALEGLLLQSPSSRTWKPLRTVMVALGHDEEVGGACGAARIAERLEATGAAATTPPASSSSSSSSLPLLHAVWDEGPGVMADGVPPLVTRPTALIATAEKRAVRVVARARAPGGHASMPPVASKSGGNATTDTGLTVGALLGRLLAAVDASPPKPQLRRPTLDMLVAAAPHADRAHMRPLVALAARLPPLRPLLARALSRASAGAAAMVCTTVVPTQLHAGGGGGGSGGGSGGGGGENVMPQRGQVVWNVRLLPGWDASRLRRYFDARLREALPDANHRAQVEVVVEEGGYSGGGAGAGVAPSSGPAFAALRGAIERCWRFERPGGGNGGASTPTVEPPLVIPTLLTGMTDSRHYARLVAPPSGEGGGGGDGGGGILRFLPLSLSRATLSRIHGTDERVSVADFARAMCTYRHGIEALGALPAVEGEGGGGTGSGRRGGKVRSSAAAGEL